MGGLRNTITRHLRFHLSRAGQLRRASAQLEDAHRRASGLTAQRRRETGAMGQRLDGETDGKTGENDAKTWENMGKWWENLGTLEQIMGYTNSQHDDLNMKNATNNDGIFCH